MEVATGHSAGSIGLIGRQGAAHRAAAADGRASVLSGSTWNDLCDGDEKISRGKTSTGRYEI